MSSGPERLLRREHAASTWEATGSTEVAHRRRDGGEVMAWLPVEDEEPAADLRGRPAGD